ncbi:zinc-dependent alcohol dehydrogenase family protein [Aeromicrobium ginsengisoli]|uniref:Zinc-dependent alcohol dehydrogenase family protein n=1 Tax=Aeromicrobium ginsengisoli TaxID=363867 RepID=A0A5M4FEN0_9ACTN|nr:zinc-dependent alcohol dehydrogenase family protein [Aeromicrobium ginsengisoli]KAA1397807.1 zinc-dependent alcohol dehydrogenase family protein [Aeromicrobium ginsengisoli]
MRATVLHGARDVRIDDVPDPRITAPTEAIVRISAACICGTDLHPYGNMDPAEHPVRIGHEFMGTVEDVGSEVTTVKRGDLVVAPFVYSDGTCQFCQAGLQTSCTHGGFWGALGVDGGQGEAVRVPWADGTLVALPPTDDPRLIKSLLTLSDVMGTGHHAALTAGVRRGDSVTVIGDGAVGLLAVLAARRLGAERIILMGRHISRTDLGREFGATDVVAARGQEGIEQVRELTNGHGTRAVIDAVGFLAAYEQACGVVRAGGVISRVGLPQYEQAPLGVPIWFNNVTLTGGIAPTRAYIVELLPEVLDGTIEPGKVFDRTVDLDGVPDGYRAMAEREALKVLVTP